MPRLLPSGQAGIVSGNRSVSLMSPQCLPQKATVAILGNFAGVSFCEEPYCRLYRAIGRAIPADYFFFTMGHPILHSITEMDFEGPLIQLANSDMV